MGQGEPYWLALDQGTTSSRALLFTDAGVVVGVGRRPVPTRYPRPGWVEQDAEAIWQSQWGAVQDVLAATGVPPSAIGAIGICNQRETALAWEKESGRPLAPALVWQDRRTAGACAALQQAGAGDAVRARTGLVLDPYFSASKWQWLLQEVPGLATRAQAGKVALGTVDSWLLYRLTGGRVHETDASNASRTLVYNIHRGQWDPDLLRLFGIPAPALPEVRPSAGLFGYTHPRLLGRPVPITGVVGDQQASLFGHGCTEPGMAKATFGTGAFLLLNLGEKPLPTPGNTLLTVAWQHAGGAAYALEASTFTSGAVVKWLVDLGLIGAPEESEAVAASVPDTAGVYLVPAFAGLGAPYWDPAARGIIVGLTQGVGRAHLVRAALEAMAYQTRDMVEAMARDANMAPPALRIDGGAARNRFLVQFLADMLGMPVDVSTMPELSAWGAARMAMWGAGHRTAPPPPALVRYGPALTADRRQALWTGWRRAVERALAWSPAG